jgi:hypothetical protein
MQMQCGRTQAHTFVMEDYSISYSFGGSEESPLVKRTILMEIDTAAPDFNLQEALLHRTDLIFADLCKVFDDAYDAYIKSCMEDTMYVEVMMGAIAYSVDKILTQSPSSKYAHMFTRVQCLLNMRSAMLPVLGEDVVDTISGFVLPLWEVLKQIDGSFADDLAL